MQIINNTDNFKIIYRPKVLRYFGIAIMLFSLVPMYAFLGGVSNYQKLETWVIAVGIIISFGVFFAGFISLWRAKFVETVIDKSLGKINISESGIFGTNYRTYNLPEVEEFKISTHYNTRFENSNDFILVLKDKSETLLGIANNLPKDKLNSSKSSFIDLNSLIK